MDYSHLQIQKNSNFSDPNTQHSHSYTKSSTPNTNYLPEPAMNYNSIGITGPLIIKDQNYRVMCVTGMNVCAGMHPTELRSLRYLAMCMPDHISQQQQTKLVQQMNAQQPNQAKDLRSPSPF